MSARIDLPFDDPINCWVLVRKIARASVPDLNAKASGIECIVAKKPDPITVTVPPDVPDIGGQLFEAQAIEQMLIDSDRQYLLRVLPDLPRLKVPFTDKVASAFLDGFRALQGRPAWQPVLLTEARWLQEESRIIAERWTKANQHLQALQHWLDTGRIRAFRSRHVPANELLVGTLIPRRDVLAYLDYCEIGYAGEDAAGVRTTPATVGDGGAAVNESTAQIDKAVGESRPKRRLVQPAQPVAVQLEAEGDALAEQVATPAQAISTGRLLSIKEVSERTGIRLSMLHEKMNPGSKYFDSTFPPKIKLGERTVRYYEAAVDVWIQSRLSATKK